MIQLNRMCLGEIRNVFHPPGSCIDRGIVGTLTKMPHRLGPIYGRLDAMRCGIDRGVIGLAPGMHSRLNAA